MTDETSNDPETPRPVTARRLVTLSGLAATLAAPVQAEAPADPAAAPAPESFLLAQAEGEGEGEGGGEGEGEGEGEGGGAALEPTTAFLRDLGFMAGHLRAGHALYEAGDLEAAKTHMGHPIEEKYDAVAARLDEMDMGDMRAALEQLVEAAEAGRDHSEVHPLYEDVMGRIDAAQDATGAGPRQQMEALAALMRVAGDEYRIATEGGEISNLHEYQDAWGFVQIIRAEAEAFAGSDDPAVAEAGQEIVGHADAVLESVFGDLQGESIPEMDASALYGAAARIELSALGIGEA